MGVDNITAVSTHKNDSIVTTRLYIAPLDRPWNFSFISLFMTYLKIQPKAFDSP
jgi:hypothetical protein